MLQETNGLEECLNILNQDSCDRLIDMFNNDIRKTPGLTGFGVSSEYKVSTELPCVLSDNQWEKYNSEHKDVYIKPIIDYKKSREITLNMYKKGLY